MRKVYLSILMLIAAGFGIKAQTINDTTNFEDMNLSNNSYWNGFDESGGYHSGSFFFPNNYNADWGTWINWACSNMEDDTTAGYLNLYSAITASGIDPAGSGGKNYGLCKIPIDFVSTETMPVPLILNDTNSQAISGLYVTNSTYAALSMEQGDDYAKKFGGENGNDPDWFSLSIWGYLDGASSDTVEFYLADYRFEENNLDYIVKNWEWVDLSSIGEFDSLMFNLHSSDVGAFGMNTPSYFCVDNIIIEKDVSSVHEIQGERLEAKVYPNPARNYFYVGMEKQMNVSLKITDLNGRILYSDDSSISNEKTDIDLPKGIYLVRISNGSLLINKKLIIR